MTTRRRPAGYRIFQGTRLEVPFEEKDQAKSLGARWNWRERFWYVPPWETNLKKFERWLPASAKNVVEQPGPSKIPVPTARGKGGWSQLTKRTLVGSFAFFALILVIANAERKPYSGRSGFRQTDSYVSPRKATPSESLVPNSPMARPSPNLPVADHQGETEGLSESRAVAGARQSGVKEAGATRSAITPVSAGRSDSAAVDRAPNQQQRHVPVIRSSSEAPQPAIGRSSRLPVLVAALCNDGARLKAAGEETCSQHGGVLAWVGSDGSYAAPAPRKKSAYAGMRVGAWCRDGSRSYATGRGACSHHGGVAQWIIGE